MCLYVRVLCVIVLISESFDSTAAVLLYYIAGVFCLEDAQHWSTRENSVVRDVWHHEHTSKTRGSTSCRPSCHRPSCCPVQRQQVRSLRHYLLPACLAPARHPSSPVGPWPPAAWRSASWPSSSLDVCLEVSDWRRRLKATVVLGDECGSELSSPIRSHHLASFHCCIAQRRIDVVRWIGGCCCCCWNIDSSSFLWRRLMSMADQAIQRFTRHETRGTRSISRQHFAARARLKSLHVSAWIHVMSTCECLGSVGNCSVDPCIVLSIVPCIVSCTVHVVSRVLSSVSPKSSLCVVNFLIPCIASLNLPCNIPRIATRSYCIVHRCATQIIRARECCGTCSSSQ